MNTIKNISLFTILLTFSAVFATSEIANEFINFKRLVKSEKDAWFKFAGKLHYQKYNLLAKQHNDWFNFGINNIKQLDNLTDISQKDTLLRHEFQNAVKLHEKHCKEMKHFWDKVRQDAAYISEKYEEQLSKYKFLAESGAGSTESLLTRITSKIHG